MPLDTLIITGTAAEIAIGNIDAFDVQAQREGDAISTLFALRRAVDA